MALPTSLGALRNAIAAGRTPPRSVKDEMRENLIARIRAKRAGDPVAVRICAACRRRESGVPHGYLHIDGNFFPAHRAEMEHLLHNEVEHAREDNPLQQVLTWEDLNGDGLLIATTTEQLAQRLGHALQRAYDGDVRYGFSHENKLARVWWHR